MRNKILIWLIRPLSNFRKFSVIFTESSNLCHASSFPANKGALFPRTAALSLSPWPHSFQWSLWSSRRGGRDISGQGAGSQRRPLRIYWESECFGCCHPGPSHHILLGWDKSPKHLFPSLQHVCLSLKLPLNIPRMSFQKWKSIFFLNPLNPSPLHSEQNPDILSKLQTLMRVVGCSTLIRLWFPFSSAPVPPAHLLSVPGVSASAFALPSSSP